MKILMIAHVVPYPPHGGSLQRNYNLLRQIASEHDVYYVALNQRALLPTAQDVAEADRELSRFCKHLKILPIPTDKSKLAWYSLLLRNLGSSEPYSVWRFRSHEMEAEIRRLTSEHNFDLVYVDTVALSPYADIAGVRPRVLNHHNVESTLLLRRAASERNPLNRWYIGYQGRKLRRYEQAMVPRFDLNLTVSDLDAAELARFCQDAKFVTIANGTDTSYFTPTPVADAPELVFAGGMGWYPNRDAMLWFCKDVFPLIQESVPTVVFHSLGKHPAPEVVEIANQEPGIEIHGFVDDVRPFFERSAVYVVPIRVGGGTRLKILDAFSAAMPLVSTTIGCEGIEVTPDENILIGDTAEEFAAQTVRLLQDRELREKLARNARRLVEQKYAWNVIGRTLNSALNELVS